MSQTREAPPKFIVLSNGLRDHLGHYLETSLAVAEAARTLGFHPVLAAHAECRRDCLPPWLESHTTFRTDHWVDSPPPGYPAAPSKFAGFCRRAQSTLGRASRWAHRAAYYFLPPLFYDLGGYVAYCCLPRIAAAQERTRAFAALRRRVRRIHYGQHAEWIEQATSWPELERALRLAADHSRRTPYGTAAEAWPAAFSEASREPMPSRVSASVGRPSRPSDPKRRPGRPPHSEYSDSLSAGLPQKGQGDGTRSVPTTLPPPAKLMDAARRLLPEGLGRELEYALVFYQDLERFLAATQAGPGDHVWLGTAHAREVLAVHWAVERMGIEHSPIFHLEFRHALFACDVCAPEIPIETPLTHMQRSLLQLHCEWGASDRMRFYTDSAALARDYESLVDLPFAVLPLPFRARLIERRRRGAGEPLTIAFLGEARDEKGFPLLPALIEALSEDYLAAGKVRFLIQSNVSQPRYNPQSVEALKHLKRQAHPGVELAARRGALSPEEYYALVSQADIVLLPYAVHAYQARTSGAMGEALAAGAAVVVTAGTWLAEQLPAGCGETFDTPETFAAAVKSIVDHFDAYRSAAEAYQPTWRRRHSPEALIAALLGEPSSLPFRAAA